MPLTENEYRKNIPTNFCYGTEIRRTPPSTRRLNFSSEKLSPVIAVNKNYLLGSGGFLNVYDIKCNKLLETIDLFNGSRIHAIRTSENGVILVYGGKKAAILSLQLDNTNNRYNTNQIECCQ